MATRDETRDPLAAHLHLVSDAIAAGRVIPLLGAGVHLAGRQPGRWQPGHQLPNGSELATHLAERFEYPDGPVEDLARVSQYVATMTGSGPLYEVLRAVFNVDLEPTALHRFLARLPSTLREKRCQFPYQLIVSTNYDDALEKAFADAEEPFDLVCYIADGDFRGKFLHSPPGEPPRLIDRPNEYADVNTENRSVILKIHGAMDRLDPDRDSYVITEDHYIDYLARADISNLVPVTLAALLKRCHFLFLGYSLRDWNLRVILHRIWGKQQLSWKSWAIQRDPSPIECEYWAKRDVEILTMAIDAYVETLQHRLETGGPTRRPDHVARLGRRERRGR